MRFATAALVCLSGTLAFACGREGTTPSNQAASPSPSHTPARTALHLAGDSTMGEDIKDRNPETGWGEELPSLFREDRLAIHNYAKRGRSSRTFQTEGFWTTLLAAVREGDFVIIQFGHNDGSADEEQTPPAEYRANFMRFVTDVRARRATPILATPVVVRRFAADGSLVDTHGPYPDIVRGVARAEGASILDMQAISARIVSEHGIEGSKLLFQHLQPGEQANYPGGLADNIHLSPRGARLLAEGAVRGLREINSPLAALLR